MQDTATLTVPISTKTPSQLGHSLVYLPKHLDPQRTPSEREKLLQQTNFEGSTIWSRRLTENILSKRTKIYSNIKILSKEDQKAIVFPFLNNTVWRNKDKSATFVSPIISKKAHDLAYLFTSSRTFQGTTPEIDLLYKQETASNLNIDEDGSNSLEPSYPICLSSPSVKNLVNLTSNLKRSYERGSAFGSLEKAHLEWMENNEIRPDRNARNKSRKLDMYRNFIYQGSNATQRSGLIEAFLMRKDLYPKKEEQGLFSGKWNEKFNGMMDTWGMWYKQGQQAAVDMIRKAKRTGNLDKAIPGLNSLSVLEDQTITIDWDKAIQCALRSHSIAQVLGIPPKILFLTGFAAIDVKQIILSPHLENIDKMIYVAQVIVKTLLKIIAIVGTKVLTSAMVGFGGLDTVTVPFGFNGEAFLAHHITTRVVDAIDVKFDNMKVQLDGIVDC